MTKAVAFPLNARQERFAQEYAATGNATRAAITAGYSAKTAYATASRMLKYVKVAARIKELLSKAAERAEVTMESIARQLDDDRALARTEGQARVAIEATVQKAKLYGLFPDKGPGAVVKNNVHVTSAEAKARVARIFRAPTNGAKKRQRIH